MSLNSAVEGNDADHLPSFDQQGAPGWRIKLFLPQQPSKFSFSSPAFLASSLDANHVMNGFKVQSLNSILFRSQVYLFLAMYYTSCSAKLIFSSNVFYDPANVLSLAPMSHICDIRLLAWLWTEVTLSISCCAQSWAAGHDCHVWKRFALNFHVDGSEIVMTSFVFCFECGQLWLTGT